jgi:hypothetical protein
MAMLTGQSIPSAATIPPSSSGSTSTRKAGEFTLEDFPALGVSQQTASTSSNHSMTKTIDRSQGSTPATPHDTPTAAMIARRVNGVTDDDSNGTHGKLDIKCMI